MKCLILAVYLAALSAPAGADLFCASFDSTAQRSWTIGHGAEWIPLPIESGPKFCVASGPELAYIRANFKGLRDVKASPNYMEYDNVWWSGDDAEFINQNL